MQTQRKATASSNPPTGRIQITGEMARQMLDKNNANRPVSRREVERLKRILEYGKWRYNGEAIKFDTRGELKDGQHRLTAIAETNIPAEILVVRDLEPEAFDTLDQGRKRTGGDVLYMKGVKRHTAAAVACSTIYRMLKAKPIYGVVDPLPAYGIGEIADRHPGLEASIEYCAGPIKQGDAGIIGLGYLAAIHYLVSDLFGEPEKAASFVEGVTQGTGLREDSPILQFRRRVLHTGRRRDVMHAQAKTAMISKVVGFHLTGTSVKYLTQPPTSATYASLIPGLTEMIEKMPPKGRFDDLNY